MARARSTWANIKPRIYRLLREDESTSWWEPALLLDLFNDRLDLWTLRLADLDEGWITEVFHTDLVADQEHYTIPASADRVKRVQLRSVDGGHETLIPLTRSEKWSAPTHHTSGGGIAVGYRPTYRLVGELIELNPRPTENRTGGLQIDMEALPDRLTADGDTLPAKYPISLETLLIYDTAVAALAVEGSQGNLGEGYRNHLAAIRDETAQSFLSVAAQRSHGRVFGEGMGYGD